MCVCAHIQTYLNLQTKERKKYNWHGVEKTIRHVRIVKTRISLCLLDSLLVRFLYIVLWKGHFEQWTDMSLLCLNLCHRIQFQSNITIIPTIKFVKTKRIQFVEIQAFYKNFTTTSILLHFNMSSDFDYFLHIQPSCIHFGLRCRKQNAKRPVL